MVTEAAVEVEVARDVRVRAELSVPTDARGVVAVLGENEPLTAACNSTGFAAVSFDIAGDATTVERMAAVFADAVVAVIQDPSLRDRPVGYFGAGVGGAAVLVAAATHVNEVAAVAALDAPPELLGTHLSAVRAPMLLMVDPINEGLIERTHTALPPLLNTSSEVQLTADAGVAAQWFDRYLRGIMRGQRREVWKSLQ